MLGKPFNKHLDKTSILSFYSKKLFFITLPLNHQNKRIWPDWQHCIGKENFYFKETLGFGNFWPYRNKIKISNFFLLTTCEILFKMICYTRSFSSN